MAFQIPVLQFNMTAASDMTAASAQFCFVKISAAGTTVLPCVAATDQPIGILQNQPAQGHQADILITGISKVRVGGTSVAANDVVSTDSAGRAATIVNGTDTASFVLGRVLAVDAATNAGGLATMLVNCLNLTRAR